MAQAQSLAQELPHAAGAAGTAERKESQEGKEEERNTHSTLRHVVSRHPSSELLLWRNKISSISAPLGPRFDPQHSTGVKDLVVSSHNCSLDLNPGLGTPHAMGGGGCQKKIILKTVHLLTTHKVY